jgi:hypothetical protein
MTPRERALGLYFKYYNRIEHVLSEEYSQHEKFIVKQCALVAADEIKEELICNLDNEISAIHAIYWEKVKREIEKL